MRFISIMLLVSMLSVGYAASAQKQTFRVVATTTQAADLARILSVGVEDIEIIPLMGAGVDPHLYKPTESDIAAMNTADMIIFSGLHLEGQFDEVFEALGEKDVLIYPLSQPVKESGFVLGNFGVGGTADDPHFWFDPRNWELTTIGLAETLGELDSDHTDIYLANGEAYVEQLRLLFEWGEGAMTSVPEGQRYLVTSHDAFQYFGDAFGWQVNSIQGISTEDEAGVGDIQKVVDFVVQNQIPSLFVESSVPPDTIEAVLEAVASSDWDAQLGIRELFSDAMGEPDTFGGTYIGMIASNVYTVLQSYQCRGVELTIPDWNADLLVSPPAELLNAEC